MGRAHRDAPGQRRRTRSCNWEGCFEDYLELVRKNPRVTRTAYQRIYDMILSHGKTEYIDNKKKLIRYHFFSDETFGGRDAIFGLDVPLMKLVNVFKSAAQGYGTEKRVILLHGPVGCSQVAPSPGCSRRASRSTRKTPEGAAYTFAWNLDKKGADGTVIKERMKCPDERGAAQPHPPRVARRRSSPSCAPPSSGFAIPEGGELCPACRFVFKELMTQYERRLRQGDRAHPGATG